MVTADELIVKDSHVVPFWNGEIRQVYFRPVEIGDTANLWTYLDWMLSASSNAAASTLMKQILLIEEFGAAYPPSPTEEADFFRRTSSGERAQRITRRMYRAMKANGLNPGNLVQASLFTRAAKKKIPSRGSTGTPREFLKLFLLMEQGLLIDEFSSREMKRLLYNTQKRTRYASAPELRSSAVFHKSGSMFSCRPERGFACEKYKGNVKNFLHGISLVEYPAKNPKLRYIVALTTNVLRVHSSELHAEVAGDIHRLMASRHGVRLAPMRRRLMISKLTPARYEKE